MDHRAEIIRCICGVNYCKLCYKICMCCGESHKEWKNKDK